MNFRKIISLILSCTMLGACGHIPEQRNFEPNQPIARDKHFLAGSIYTQNGHTYPEAELEDAIKFSPDAQDNMKTAHVYSFITGLALLTSLIAAIMTIPASSRDRPPLTITWGVSLGVGIITGRIADHYYNNAVEIYNQKVKPSPTASLLNYSWQF